MSALLSTIQRYIISSFAYHMFRKYKIAFVMHLSRCRFDLNASRCHCTHAEPRIAMIDRSTSLRALPIRNRNHTDDAARFQSSDFPRPIPTTYVANDPVLACGAMRKTIETRSHAQLKHGMRVREEVIPSNQEYLMRRDFSLSKMSKLYKIRE